MRAGFAADFPCAIVENGARPEQRRLATTLGDAAACIAREGLRSPAVFVIGRVCELADRFDWFSRLPMRGRRVLAAPDAACLSRAAAGARRARGRHACAEGGVAFI